MAIPHRGVGRRQFLARTAKLAAVTQTPFIMNLAGMAGASAANASDFKALVCIFLAGGNDQSNTVVPLGTAEYAAYRKSRPKVALDTTQLRPINPVGWPAGSLGLHSGLGPLRPLVNSGAVAILANVGTLVQPTNKAQWNSGSPTVPVPRQLFSHADQQGAWQTGLPDRASLTGWLGRIGDLTQSAFNSGQISISMSVAGNAIMMSGAQTIQFQLTTQGAIPIYALDGLYGYGAGGDAMRALLTGARANLLEAEYNRVNNRAITSEAIVASALASVNSGAGFPQTWMGAQLSMVSRMIAAHAALGQRRQIFFVMQGGYDFHDGLSTDQFARFKELGDALVAFQAANTAHGLAANVTTFTASDFGRALVPNNDGSDHGWGGHHFIMGGAVKGNRIYGTFPQVVAGGAEDAGQGRLIPTTSVDEYAATLARWFGVADSDLTTVVPNIGRFANPNLGFLG